jgi:hypothetical protein
MNKRPPFGALMMRVEWHFPRLRGLLSKRPELIEGNPELTQNLED